MCGLSLSIIDSTIISLNLELIFVESTIEMTPPNTWCGKSSKVIGFPNPYPNFGLGSLCSLFIAAASTQTKDSLLTTRRQFPKQCLCL